MRRSIGALVLTVLSALLAACSSSGNASAPAASTSTTVAPAIATTTTVPRCTVTTQTSLQRIDLTVGGKARYALVHLPAHWDGKTAMPLVLSFHGLGASAENQRSTDGFVARSDKDGFIVVYPQAGIASAYGAAWDLKGEGDVPYVSALLDA